MSTDSMVSTYEDPAALRRKINAARRVSFFIATSTTLVTTFDEDGKPLRGYDDMPSNVQVTQAEAMKWCKGHESFANVCEQSGKPRPRIKLTKYPGQASCWFIG